MMKVTDYIVDAIDRLPKGYVFTYEVFISKVNKKEAVIKALNRMAASGHISKLSKGKYYKPEETIFGELAPDQYQVVKDLLEEDGKSIGYLTGLSIYNKLGLTTQVSNTIQIGKNEIRSTFIRERFTISFIKQKNTITKENIPLLQLLDSIRYIKRIPDTTIVSACRRLFAIIKKISKDDLSKMVRLSKKYPPYTRAILGAILDELGHVEITGTLRNTLNPITSYKFPGVNTVLTTAKNWNIK